MTVNYYCRAGYINLTKIRLNVNKSETKINIQLNFGEKASAIQSAIAPATAQADRNLA
jgi:hypothetical protein